MANLDGRSQMGDTSTLGLVDDDEYDDDAPSEPEVYTTCWDCEEALAKSTTREEDAFCEDCDPDKPPKYLMGALTRNGKKIDHGQAESYRKVKHLAEDAFDLVLEWETPYGDTFISFPDGSVVDAREWIERPENLDLAGGRDQYAGRGEFDPSAPDRCWLGQTLPSGRLARPLAKSYDDVAELAAHVCKEVFDTGRMDTGRGDGTAYTVMLPGGQLGDACDWAQRPETRRLAGCMTVRNHVRFRATGTCDGCGASLSTTSTRVIQGEIGEQVKAAAAIYCDTCDQYLPAIFVPITLVDDASATNGAPPRLIGDADPESPNDDANTAQALPVDLPTQQRHGGDEPEAGGEVGLEGGIEGVVGKLAEATGQLEQFQIYLGRLGQQLEAGGWTGTPVDRLIAARTAVGVVIDHVRAAAESIRTGGYAVRDTYTAHHQVGDKNSVAS